MTLVLHWDIIITWIGMPQPLHSDYALDVKGIKMMIDDLSINDDFDAQWDIIITWIGMPQPLHSDYALDVKGAVGLLADFIAVCSPWEFAGYHMSKMLVLIWENIIIETGFMLVGYGEDDENYECYFTRQEFTVDDTTYTIGVTCTYNNDNGGAFREGFTDTYASSFYQLYPPRGRGANSYHNDEDSYDNWLAGDIKGLYYCCEESSLCDLYESRRPRSRTNGYVAPSISNNRGDPHFTTLDGFEYTFNGWSEYIILQVYYGGNKISEVQGRTAPVIDNSYATVFTAFAHKCDDNVAEFVVDAAKSDFTMTIYESGTPKSVDKSAVLNGESEFTSDDGFRVEVTHENKTASNCKGVTMIVDLTTATIDSTDVAYFGDVSFIVPKSGSGFSIRGCMGNNDGNANNEFNDRDGNPVDPQPDTDEARYNHITGIWVVYSHFHMQVYESVIGGATKQTGQAFAESADALANVAPSISGGDVTLPVGYQWREDGLFAVLVGTEYNVELTAEDANGDDVTFSVEGLAGTTVSETGELVFTVPDTAAFTLTLTLSDGKAESVYPMRVASCQCENNAECDFDNPVVGTEANNGLFFRASCDCTPGYAGVDCSQDYDSCSTSPCYPGVVCTDEPPPSIAPVCGSCPDGLVGDGITCADKDECTSTNQIENKEYCSQLCTNSLKSCIQEGDITVCVGGYECSCYAGNELQADGKTCRDINECQATDSPCHGSATCENTDGSFTCRCNAGFTGDGITTCEDVNECEAETYPCSEISACTNTEGSFTCACPSGYIGDGQTCEDVDECARPDLNPCRDHSTCVNTLGSYSCPCDAPAYKEDPTDNSVCIDVDECADESDLCDTDATCTDTEGSYTCECNSGYAGNGLTCADIDECTTGDYDCSENSYCSNTVGSYDCLCDSGYEASGDTCVDENECNSSPGPCWDDSTCSNIVGSYECICNDGFVVNANGDGCTDIDECANDLDDCDGSCTNDDPPTKFTCTCPSGYTLDTDGTSCIATESCTDDSVCDANADCASDGANDVCRCLNGFQGDGTSCTDIDECTDETDTCDADNGICNNVDGTYECSCAAGYKLATDDRTCINYDECIAEDDDCDANAACADTVGSFTCTCNTGYSGNGVTCSDDNECTLGTDSCAESHSTCTNTDGSYTCACDSGYHGNAWEECFDIDECLAETSPCATNTVCVNTPGSFTCTCRTGYEGDTPSDPATSCTDIDECADSTTCHANAECNNIDGSYTCECNTGFRGDGLSCTDINECVEDGTLCHSKATCTNTAGTYTCACNEGYSGDGKTDCTDIDECTAGTDDCDTNAACTNNAGSFACQCNDGYTNIAGGTGDATEGDCEDVDECTLNTDECGSSTDCTNNAGSYTCPCSTGYERMEDGINCQDIDECTTGDHECLTADNKKCKNTAGSHECECQTGYYEENTECVEADSRQLSAKSTHHAGLSVPLHFDAINTVTKKDEFAADVKDMLDNDSTLNAKLKSVTFYSLEFTEGDTYAGVTVNINLDATNDITDAYILAVFNNELTGGTSDTIPPDNKIVAGSASVGAAELNPCVEGTATCETKDNYGCIYLGNNEHECGCLEGYEDNSGTCEAVNPCDGDEWRTVCSALHFTECVYDGPGDYSCATCIPSRTEVDGVCEKHKRYVVSVKLTSFGAETTLTETLEDTTSAEFLDLQTKVCKYLRSAIRASNPDMEAELAQGSCYITSLEDGSIIVNSVLGFDETASHTEGDVQTAITDGAPAVDLSAQGLTDLTVDESSFSVNDPSSITCPANYCYGRGTCTIEQRYYQPVCTCSDGYSGVYCEEDPPGRKLSGGEIAGIVIGCLVFIVLVVIIIVVIIKVAGKGTKVHPPTPEPGNDPERQ
ncbi:uncharacterized protein [Amphiura filiformis]|uniref:uncharacterized protein n=1 Tax=Amphiura filiformis TaxID=82378 RepID=UPI003B211AD5